MKEYALIYQPDGPGRARYNGMVSAITYDNLGHPRKMTFAGGEETWYVYTPAGVKVREIHRTLNTSSIIMPLASAGGGIISPVPLKSDTTDYIGPVIYRNGRPEMLRYSGGYASLSKVGGKYVPDFYHYITDYLGNNRAVVRASTGVLEQITHYYPWGGVYADMGKGASLQPFKYGDKELDLSNGLARYDYTARAYVPATLRFDRVDNSAVKYAHQSPYIFCGNNPVNNIDPDGNDWVTAWYEDDYFYFWHPDIKCQEDVAKIFYDNEGIEYLGSNVKLDIGEKGVILSSNGEFKINGIQQTNEFDSNSLHIGNMRQVDRETILNNWYGNYLGPNNPNNGNNEDRYSVPPINALDYAAFKHDKDYDKIGAKGPESAILNKKTQEADDKLVDRAAKFLISGNHSGRAQVMASRTATSFTFLILLKQCQKK